MVAGKKVRQLTFKSTPKLSCEAYERRKKSEGIPLAAGTGEAF